MTPGVPSRPMKMMTHLTSPSLGILGESGDLLVVPLGSTEQHGPHLPVTTDTDVAVALAASLASRMTGVVLAPAIPYGSSGEHQHLPGTVSIGAEALELLLVELGRSASHTFRRMLVVSAHGGNAEPLARAVKRLRAEGRDVRCWEPRWPAADAHAGRTETSLLLHLAADRVAMDRAEPGNVSPLTELLPRLRRSGITAVSSNGVLGDPTTASAMEGRRMLEDATESLAAYVERWIGSGLASPRPPHP